MKKNIYNCGMNSNSRILEWWYNKLRRLRWWLFERRMVAQIMSMQVTPMFCTIITFLTRIRSFSRVYSQVPVKFGRIQELAATVWAGISANYGSSILLGWWGWQEELHRCLSCGVIWIAAWQHKRCDWRRWLHWKGLIWRGYTSTWRELETSRRGRRHTRGQSMALLMEKKATLNLTPWSLLSRW